MPGQSPTQRTLATLRRLGWEAQVVEKWIAQARRRVDFAGCVDIIAWHPEWGILAVQTTSASHAADRMAKATTEPRLHSFLLAGHGTVRFEVWSWMKSARTGKWTLRRQELGATDYSAEEL